MKNFIGAATLFTALVGPAASAETTQERCLTISGLAHRMMVAHQEGVPLSDMISIIERNTPDPQTVEGFMYILLRAYGEPRFHTEAAQQRSAAKFRDEIHVWCLS